MPRPDARPPAAVVVAVALTAVTAVAGVGGLVRFGVLDVGANPAAGSPQAVGFAAVGVALQAAALGHLPGLWRGRPRAWHVLTCYLAASTYFNAYKVLVEREADAVVLLAVHLAVAGLLLLPSARRHARVTTP